MIRAVIVGAIYGTLSTGYFFFLLVFLFSQLGGRAIEREKAKEGEEGLGHTYDGGGSFSLGTRHRRETPSLGDPFLFLFSSVDNPQILYTYIQMEILNRTAWASQKGSKSISISFPSEPK